MFEIGRGLKNIKFENLSYVDKVLYVVVEVVAIIFRGVLGDTRNGANILTAISSFFKILCLYYLYDGKSVESASFMFAQYFFDCCDGYYARKFDQATVLGCYLDHLSDLIFYAAFFLFLVMKKMLFEILVCLVLVFASTVDIMMIERNYNNYTPLFKKLEEYFGWLLDLPGVTRLPALVDGTKSIIIICVILFFTRIPPAHENWMRWV